MSESERQRLVHRGAEAWNDGDLDAILELLDDDFEMRLAGAFLGLERGYRGRDGYREFWNDFRDMWKEIEVGVDTLEEFDSAVLAELHFRGIGREDVPVEMPFYACFHIPGDKIRLWSNYVERDRALKLARSLGGAKAGSGE